MAKDILYGTDARNALIAGVDKYDADADNADGWVGIVAGYNDAEDIYSISDFGCTEAGVYSINLDKINGNNIKLVIVDNVTGKTMANFTPSANSTTASFSFNFTRLFGGIVS